MESKKRERKKHNQIYTGTERLADIVQEYEK